MLQALIELDKECHDVRRLTRHALHPFGEPGPRFGAFKIGLEFLAQLFRVLEREVFGVFLDEEIERVDGDHLDHQADIHNELAGLLREHVAGNEIAERILLPVQKMLAGLDL